MLRPFVWINRFSLYRDNMLRNLKVQEDEPLELLEVEQPVAENPPVVNELPLQKIIDSYLQNQGCLTARQEGLKQAVLALISVSGSSLYILPANLFALQYGQSYAGALTWEREVNYIVGTCLPALAVLYNSTDLFFEKRWHEAPPEALAEYFIPPPRGWKRWLRDGGIVFGAAISALPLALLSFQYSLPGIPLGVQILQAIVIEIDNTVLHFLPIQLAMEYPIYRFPVLPIEWIVRRCQGYQLLDAGPEIVRDQRVLLVAYLNRVRKALRFHNHWECRDYQWEFSEEFVSGMTAENGVNLLAVLAREFPPNRLHCYRENTSYPRLHKVLSTISGLLGGGWVLSSCIGYLISPFNQLLTWTHNTLLAVLVTTPSVYFLTVLLTFFGWSSGLRIYDLLSKWDAHEPKLPLEFKLYPKLYVLCLLLNIYLNLYSYAAAEGVLINSFPGAEWAELRGVLVWFVRSGIVFLGLTALNDFCRLVFKKVARYSDTEVLRLASRLDDALELLINQLHKCEERVFLEHGVTDYFLSVLSDVEDVEPVTTPPETTQTPVALTEHPAEEESSSTPVEPDEKPVMWSGMPSWAISGLNAFWQSSRGHQTAARSPADEEIELQKVTSLFSQ